MGTFLQNWMMLRAQSAPRGGEIPDPLVDDYVQNGLIIHLDGKMKGGDPTKWIDRKGLVSFNYGSAITPAADGVITAEGGAVASNEVFANHYIDTTNYSFEMVWELISSPGVFMIFATPRSDYDNGPYIGVLASGVLFGDPSTGPRMRMSMSVPTDYRTLQITSGISSSTMLVDGVSQSIAGADYFGGTDLHFWLGSPGGRKLPNAKLKCIRVYNRPLTTSEMLHNLAVDNERFNLGLRIYIPFADPAVEAICVANWSSDGVGLTLDDAARVTSLGGKFKNTNITTFKELLYFSGLSSVDHFQFQGCSALETLGIPVANWGTQGMALLENIYIEDLEVFTLNAYSRGYRSLTGAYKAVHLFVNDAEVTTLTVPSSIINIPQNWAAQLGYVTSFVLHNGITSIGTGAFGACKAWASADLVLPSALTAIGDRAFMSCSSLEKITIPASVTSIGGQAFERCSSLAELICLATTPPDGAWRAFRYDDNLRIYVPYSSDHSILSAYQTAQNWSDFASKIYELNPDGTIPS